MKVISILQPWASLIVLGHKKIETRSWNTKIRGEILIHASMGKEYKNIPAEDPLYKYYHMLFAHNKIDPIEKLPFGCIIGKVSLEHCVQFSGNDFGWGRGFGLGEDFKLTEQEKAFGDYTAGRYGWLLSDPVVFEKPIPAKGKLGIWEYDMLSKNTDPFLTDNYDNEKPFWNPEDEHKLKHFFD